jgi:nitroreductase
VPASSPRRSSPLRYRRASHVVSYWQDDQLVLHNYATGVRMGVAPQAIEMLACCREWRTPAVIAREARLSEDVPVETLLTLLVEATFLERSDRVAATKMKTKTKTKTKTKATATAAQAYDAWNGWNPVASFFHASTRDIPFAESAPADDLLRRKAVTDPPPAMLKRTRAVGKKAGTASSNASAKAAASDVALPPPAALPGLTDTLTARRTWRRFGGGTISRADLATLLHLTWGVQQWMAVDGFGQMPLKTSPSGGARHSIEAYAFVRKVQGVRPGLYHYGPDDHTLYRLDAPSSPFPTAAVAATAAQTRTRTHGQKAASPRRQALANVSDYLPTQTWYDDVSVVIFMTAIFARAQWRYSYARAYRSILTEAGHLAQTFCLLATRLGLAPFCSMALADSRIEYDLGIDGVSESVIYAAGAGTRPDGVAWAPWPDRDDVPARRPSAWTKKTKKMSR